MVTVLIEISFIPMPGQISEGVSKSYKNLSEFGASCSFGFLCKRAFILNKQVLCKSRLIFRHLVKVAASFFLQTRFVSQDNVLYKSKKVFSRFSILKNFHKTFVDYTEQTEMSRFV